jgi:hypothetical protein
MTLHRSIGRVLYIKTGLSEQSSPHSEWTSGALTHLKRNLIHHYNRKAKPDYSFFTFLKVSPYCKKYTICKGGGGTFKTFGDGLYRQENKINANSVNSSAFAILHIARGIKDL